MFQHYIWDFDGTLFDTYPYIARSFQQALAVQGIYETTDSILTYIKISLDACIDHFQKKHNFRADLRNLYEQYEQSGDDSSIKPYPDLELVLKRIVNLNGKNYLYTHRGKDALDYLAQYGLISLFTDTITKEDGFPRKPAPDAINHLIHKHGMDKRTAIMIGDRDIDIMAGWNAGISGCLFDPDDYYAHFQVEYRVKSMLEFADMLLIEP